MSMYGLHVHVLRAWVYFFIFFSFWLSHFYGKIIVLQFMQWVTENLGFCARVPIDYNEPGYVM